MATVSAKPPSGTRDFLAPAVLRRRWVVATIQSAYERHGFVPLETPATERLDVLLGKYGPEGDQLLFKILRRRDEFQRAVERGGAAETDFADLGLRYDLTVPLARVVAAYPSELPRFYKRYQIQPVWRADRPQKGRFREFYQCDVDFVGSTSPVAEFEVMSAVMTALSELGFSEFTVRINDRRVLAGLMGSAGISPEHQSHVLIAIDKADKIGADGARAELRAGGLSEEQVGALGPALEPLAGGEPGAGSRLAAIDSYFAGRSAVGAEGCATLRAILGLLDAAPPAAGTVSFDPTLARGLSYYTGPIFEIAVPGLAGSMGGGGRYDNLVGMFLGKEVPAVGFSLGLERILVVMEERGMLPDDAGRCDIMLTQLEESARVAVLRLATELRRAGVRVEVFPEVSRLGKQIQYAESIGIPRVGILGQNEIREGRVALKELATGEQTSLPLAEAIARLAP